MNTSLPSLDHRVMMAWWFVGKLRCLKQMADDVRFCGLPLSLLNAVLQRVVILSLAYESRARCCGLMLGSSEEAVCLTGIARHIQRSYSVLAVAIASFRAS